MEKEDFNNTNNPYGEFFMVGGDDSPPNSPASQNNQPADSLPKIQNNNSKRWIIILISAVLLLIIITFGAILIINSSGKKPDIKFDNNIKLVLFNEKNAIEIFLSNDIDLNKVENIKFIFYDSENEDIQYSPSVIARRYKINASELELDNFNEIKRVDAEIQYKNDTPAEIINITGPTGCAALNCSYYYSSGKCGVELENNCTDKINCTQCNENQYCYRGQDRMMWNQDPFTASTYIGEETVDVCIDNTIKCIDNDNSNTSIKGIVNLTSLLGAVVKEDECLDNSSVEYYCHYNGTGYQIRNKTVPCEYSCQNGTCIKFSCMDECNINNITCQSETQYKECGNYDSDSCLEWAVPLSCIAPNSYCKDGGCVQCLNDTNCPAGESCSNYTCVATCTDDCTFGNKTCQSETQYKECGNYDADSCLDWGTPTLCSSPNSYCKDGSCVQCLNKSHCLSGQDCKDNICAEPSQDERVNCSAANSRLFVTSSCPTCVSQLTQLGEYKGSFNITDCDIFHAECTSNNIQAVPTWIFSDGHRYVGALTLDEIIDRTGC